MTERADNETVDTRPKRRGFRLPFKGRVQKKSAASAAATTTGEDGSAAPNSPKNLIVVAKMDRNNNYTTAERQQQQQRDLLVLAQKQQQGGFVAALGRSICRTKAFRSMCDKVFDMIDTDGSGSIDEKELYTGLLLIHLKLGMYAGPPACARPLERERCRAIMEQLDTDGSGELSRQEFRQVMVLLFGNVLLRVLVMWSATIILVPFFAKSILDGIIMVRDRTESLLATLDAESPLVNAVELTVQRIYHVLSLIAVSFLLPSWLLQFFRLSQQLGSFLLGKVPESVWVSLPLTLISTLLSVVVVPWVLLNIDEFFSSLAGRNSKKVKP